MDAPTTIFALPRRTGWPCLQHLAGTVAMCALVACSGDDAGGDAMGDGSGGSGDVAIPSDGADNGMGGAGQGGSDSVATGLGRPTPDIAPSAPPVEGEGDACRFSIECGPRQVCLDDECIREERVDRDAVTFGEARWMPAYDERRPTFIQQAAPFEWRVPQLGANLLTMRSWTYPGPSGPQLVFHQRYYGSAGTGGVCEVGVLGESFRVVAVEDVHCQLAAVHTNGDLAMIGFPTEVGEAYRNPQFLRVSPGGEVVWRAELPDEVRWLLEDHELPTGTALHEFLGASAMFYENDLYFVLWIQKRNLLVLAQGGPDELLVHPLHLDEEGLIDPATLFQPEFGWLLSDDKGLRMLLGDNRIRMPMVLRAIPSRETEPLGTPDVYGLERYQQLTQDDWVVSLAYRGTPMDDDEFMLFRSDGSRLVFPLGGPNLFPTEDDRLPSTTGAMMTDHPRYSIAVLESEGMTFRDEEAEIQHVVPYPWDTAPRYPSYAALSRFKLTVEGFLRTSPHRDMEGRTILGDRRIFDWFELPLTMEGQ